MNDKRDKLRAILYDEEDGVDYISPDACFNLSGQHKKLKMLEELPEMSKRKLFFETLIGGKKGWDDTLAALNNLLKPENKICVLTKMRCDFLTLVVQPFAHAEKNNKLKCPLVEKLVNKIITKVA